MTILQVPHEVYWNDKGNLAYFIVAIAANSHEHLHLLSLLTTALSHEELAYFLGKEASIDDIFNILNAPQTVIKKYIASGARMAFKGLSHPMGFAYGSIYLLQDFNHDLHMPALYNFTIKTYSHKVNFINTDLSASYCKITLPIKPFFYYFFRK